MISNFKMSRFLWWFVKYVISVLKNVTRHTEVVIVKGIVLGVYINTEFAIVNQVLELLSNTCLFIT